MSDQTPRSRDVFISYAKKDKEWADAACATLEARGRKCWIAPRDIPHGSNWMSAITDGIDACKMMVLILTADANASKEVQQEVGLAYDNRMTVLPLRVEDVAPKGAIRYAVGNTHWLNGFTPPRELRLEELANAVESLIRKSPPIPPVKRWRWTRLARRILMSIVVIALAIWVWICFVEPRIPNTLGMTFMQIPAGEFEMGSDARDQDAGSDEKVNERKHHVTITKPFELGTTEVTVGQFSQFVEGAKYVTDAERDINGGHGWDEVNGKDDQKKEPKYTWRSPGFPQTKDHPVVLVSWNDALAFCEWLSKREGRTYRLPTEAEGEYACRAGTNTRYSSGDDPESLATVGNVRDGTARHKYPTWDTAIYAEDGFVFTAPVRQFKANDFGLFDMHGNVLEWCADWYDPDYYAKPEATVDPLNSSKARYRVLRGGGWSTIPRNDRSAIREAFPPDYNRSHVGFRVARARRGQ